MTPREQGVQAAKDGERAEANPYPLDSKEYDEWWMGFSQPYVPRKETWWEKAARQNSEQARGRSGVSSVLPLKPKK